MKPEDKQTTQSQPVNQVPEQQVSEEQTSPQSVQSEQSMSDQQPQNQFQTEDTNKPADKLKSITPKLVKILLIIFIVIGALFFINLFAPRAIQMIKENNPLSSPTPEPTPTVAPVVNFPPSKYANDADVLQIEEQLVRLEKGLNDIEFSDDTLHPPLLDWEISFEK